MVHTKYIVVFQGRRLKSTIGTKAEAELALKRIVAGFKGMRKLPSRVPRRMGRVEKLLRR